MPSPPASRMAALALATVASGCAAQHPLAAAARSGAVAAPARAAPTQPSSARAFLTAGRRATPSSDDRAAPPPAVTEVASFERGVAAWQPVLWGADGEAGFHPVHWAGVSVNRSGADSASSSSTGSVSGDGGTGVVATTGLADNANGWACGGTAACERTLVLTTPQLDNASTAGYPLRCVSEPGWRPCLTFTRDWRGNGALRVKWSVGDDPARGTGGTGSISRGVNEARVTLEVLLGLGRLDPATGAPRSDTQWVLVANSTMTANGPPLVSAADLGALPASALGAVVAVRFRVVPQPAVTAATAATWAHVWIYSIKLVARRQKPSRLTLAMPFDRAVATDAARASSRGAPAITATSAFVGTVYYDLLGRYSPTGFYDDAAGRWRVWAGGGIPEAPACDNVWYSELDQGELPNADPDHEVQPPVRCTVASRDLYPAQGPHYGYGGDPTVVSATSPREPRPRGSNVGAGGATENTNSVRPTHGEQPRGAAVTSDGSTAHGGSGGVSGGSAAKAGDGQLAMYFSGLQQGTTWNQVFRAVSSDGVAWTVDPPSAVVPASSGGVAGYGTGSPSAVWVNSTHLNLWYYSQSEPGGAGMFLRTSTDGGRTFPEATRRRCSTQRVMDVKWVASMKLFVGVYYDQRSDGCDGQSGVSVAVSSDGVEWSLAPPSSSLPANFSQDPTACLCSNPGWVGSDAYGHGTESMLVAYGSSVTQFGVWEYYSRQLVATAVNLTLTPADGGGLSAPSGARRRTGAGAWTHEERASKNSPPPAHAAGDAAARNGVANNALPVTVAPPPGNQAVMLSESFLTDPRALANISDAVAKHSPRSFTTVSLKLWPGDYAPNETSPLPPPNATMVAFLWSLRAHNPSLQLWGGVSVCPGRAYDCMLNRTRSNITGQQIGAAAVAAGLDGVTLYATPYCNNANCKRTTAKYAEGIAAIVAETKAATRAHRPPNGIAVSWYQNEWDNPQIVAAAGGSPLFSYQTVFYLDSLSDCLRQCGAACGAGESAGNIVKSGRNFTELMLELGGKVRWVAMNRGAEVPHGPGTSPPDFWDGLAAFQAMRASRRG